MFEARRPKDSAIIAENNGKIEFGKELRGKLKVSIVSPEGQSSSYLIPKGKHINFNPGEGIKKGEYLLDGSPAPHDILRILGTAALTEYFVNEVQEVYRLQGVVINDKHIETILRQMLKKVKISDPGDSTFLPNEDVFKDTYDETNKKLKSSGKKLATGKPILQGITKAALLAACARVIKIPSRVGFGDVRNHLATPRLIALMGTDEFVFHGFAELYLNGQWVKATPAFNLTLCERFGVLPLEFDGMTDSLFHPFDAAGQRHMEYIRQRGSFDDVPFEDIMAAFKETYPVAFARGFKLPDADFERDAGKI